MRRSKRAAALYDVWAVPLSAKEFGYVHVILKDDEGFGDLVRVYKHVSAEPVLSDSLFDSAECCAVFTIVEAGAKAFGWRCVGNRIVEVSLPRFRWSRWGPLGNSDDWAIWAPQPGAGFSVDAVAFVGHVRPEHEGLEVLTTWSPAVVAERIRECLSVPAMNRGAL